MQFVSLLALLTIAVMALFAGLRVRRTSFLAGTYMTRLDSDRWNGGWIEWILVKHPSICHLLDAISDVLPGRGADITDTVSATTSFTRVQSHALLHRYYRLQVHNMLRVIMVIVFCGMLLAIVPEGLTQSTHKIVGVGSSILCLYAMRCWWRIDRDCRNGNTRLPRSNAESVHTAFHELSRSAALQALAFALMFGMNVGLQVVEYLDVNNSFALNGDVEGGFKLPFVEECPT
ncbi:MAG: hypothetical protein ACI8TQ_003929 [Planctomycetota bacterium]|jgi:hypothetical protein